MADIVPQGDLPANPVAPKAASIVPTEDIPSAHAVPDEDLVTEKPINNAKAVVEGVGRGMTFGATDVLQHGIRSAAENLGSDNPSFWADSDADIAERKDSTAGKIGEAIGTIGGLTKAAVSAPGLVAKGIKAMMPEATGFFTKLGSAAIASGIESGAIQGGDEISKAMLGKGDPKAPVSSALANMGYAGLIGGTQGALFSGVSQGGMKGLVAIENAKMGDRAENALTGMGLATKAHNAGATTAKEAKQYITNYFRDLGLGAEFDYRPYAPGVDLYFGGLNKTVSKTTGLVADGVVGYGVGKAFGTGAGLVAANAAHKYIAPTVEKILAKPLIGVTNKIAIPTVMYALSKGQTTGLFNALNHATQAAKGAKAIGKGVDAVLKAGTMQAVDFAASDKDKQKIIDYIDEGGIDKEMQDSLQANPPDQEAEGFAEGGEVADMDGGNISSLYPDQDMLMNAAKARISNYLSSIKPTKNPNKLPFDKKPNLSEQEKTFDNAVSLAASPLSILKHIKDGSLKAEQVKHFTSLYPELHEHLAKKFTNGIMHAQLDEEMLPYNTRKALSLFMGTALDSTMTPQAIIAAQAVFLPKQAPMPQNDKNKKGSPSKLGKENKAYKTVDQAAESDRSSRD